MDTLYPSFFFFFFNDTATTEIYTLSLHDALPIFGIIALGIGVFVVIVIIMVAGMYNGLVRARKDRKSTRLNSSHANISYAVFCLKKKKKNVNDTRVLCNKTTIIQLRGLDITE